MPQLFYFWQFRRILIGSFPQHRRRTTYFWTNPNWVNHRCLYEPTISWSAIMWAQLHLSDYIPLIQLIRSRLKYPAPFAQSFSAQHLIFRLAQNWIFGHFGRVNTRECPFYLKEHSRNYAGPNASLSSRIKKSSAWPNLGVMLIEVWNAHVCIRILDCSSL